MAVLAGFIQMIGEGQATELVDSICDAIMYHMRKATVRDLRYKFPKIEAELLSGEEIEITKRNRVIARLLPVRPQRRKTRPDFLKMLRDIYGDKIMKTAGIDLVSEQRGRF
jgi:antitoxin (DNA-binding transcriptional repressor) of toxin-antitoxin stability system